MKKKQAVRQVFRDVCFKRDKDTCKCCGYEPTYINLGPDITVHHIVDRRFLPEELKYVPENGITVCDDCHVKAEQFHINEGKSWVEGYHPNDLYSLIRSSWRLERVKMLVESWYTE